MTVTTLVEKNNRLVKAYKSYQKRYTANGKKPNIKKLLPGDLFSTMRLEGERITKKEAKTLY